MDFRNPGLVRRTTGLYKGLNGITNKDEQTPCQIIQEYKIQVHNDRDSINFTIVTVIQPHK